MNPMRMFLIQTKMNFLWYFRRDGEMMFWTLAMPVFFLVLFSFAFAQGPSSRSASFLVPGIIGAQVLSSGFWGVGVMLATLRENGVEVLEELTGSSGNRVAFVAATDGAQMEIIEKA